MVLDQRSGRVLEFQGRASLSVYTEVVWAFDLEIGQWLPWAQQARESSFLSPKQGKRSWESPDLSHRRSLAAVTFGNISQSVFLTPFGRNSFLHLACC